MVEQAHQTTRCSNWSGIKWESDVAENESIDLSTKNTEHFMQKVERQAKTWDLSPLL